MRIIIVDDNADARVILKKTLEAQGHRIEEAANGEEALNLAKQSPPDAIISDILMPVMDGFHLLKKVRAEQRLKDARFIFYTATYLDPKDEELAMKLGADAFLIKPMESKEFIRAVMEAMEKAVNGGRGEPEPEESILKLYNERLVRKLEKKMLALEREVAARKEAEEALRESEQRLTFKNRIAHTLMIAPEDEMYGKVLEAILEALASPFGIFGYIDEGGDWVCPSLTREIWEACQVPEKDIRFPHDTWGGIWGKALTERRTFLSNTPMTVPEGHIAVNKALCVPIIHGETLTGLLVVGNKKEDYDQRDRERLEIIAEYIAPVLHARLQRDRQQKEKERLNSQLQQAQKMEAIGTLAGGIAHDFNNILSAIIGYSELAMMNVPEGSAVIADLDQVLRAGKRATALVQQILTVSRRHQEERRPVQIRDIVEEALTLVRASLPATITIRQDLDKNSGIVHADPNQIHQVIMNLCTNAGHAMEGGGVLSVDLENVEFDEFSASQYLDMGPGSYLKLTVSDTGCGMAPEILDHIFDPYFTTKEVGAGTGLGLSVAQGIVKGCGGTIRVYSEPGKGSTFQVYLPVIKAAEKEAEKPEGPLPTGSERVLFVDDEQALADLSKLMLEGLGYEVVTMTSSMEALELFKTKPEKFDLVITDMTMPHMTGDKLARELMKIRPDIPVILCTGHSKLISKERAEEMGIKALLMKPIPRRVMAETVREALGD